MQIYQKIKKFWIYINILEKSIDPLKNRTYVGKQRSIDQQQESSRLLNIAMIATVKTEKVTC